MTCTSSRPGDLFMLIRAEAGEVSHISFDGLNAEHFLDEDEPAPTDPYTFTPYDTLSGGTITACTRTESGWEIQVPDGKTGETARDRVQHHGPGAGRDAGRTCDLAGIRIRRRCGAVR